MAIWRSEDSANDHGRTKRVGFSVAAGSERRDAFYAAVETYPDIGAGCHELRVTDTGGMAARLRGYVRCDCCLGRVQENDPDDATNDSDSVRTAVARLS